MDEKTPQVEQPKPAFADLPTQVTPQKAEDVKGGVLRRGGDDDLDDLEVER